MAVTHFKRWNFAGGRIGGKRIPLLADLRNNFWTVNRSVEGLKTAPTTSVVLADSQGPSTLVPNPGGNYVAFPLHSAQTFHRGNFDRNMALIWRSRMPVFGGHRVGNDITNASFIAAYAPFTDRSVRLYHRGTAQKILISNPLTNAEWAEWRTYIYLISEESDRIEFWSDGELLGSVATFDFVENVVNPITIGRAYGNNTSTVDIYYQYFAYTNFWLTPAEARYLSLGDNIFQTLEPEYFRFWPVGIGGVAPPENEVSEIPSATVNVSAYAPTVTVPANVVSQIPSAAVDVASFAPTVDAGTDALISVPSATVTVNSYAPTTDAGTDALVSVPSVTVTVTSFAPTVSVGADEVSQIPSSVVTVTSFAPTVDAGTDALVGIPSATANVTPFAPKTMVGADEVSQIPSTSVIVNAYAPTTSAVADVISEIPSSVVNVNAYAPSVQTGADQVSQIPSATVQVNPYSPVVTAPGDIFSLVPSSTISVTAFAPRVQAGIYEGNTLQDGFEEVRSLLEPELTALGLDQILWPNMPKKRDSTKPFAQVFIGVEDRELTDLGGFSRCICNVNVNVYTPYGKNPREHDSYVNGVMRILNNKSQNNILFFDSIPQTIGRRDSWWVTNVETSFYLEGV